MTRVVALAAVSPLLILLALASPGPASGQPYKCTAADGKVTYSDELCGEDAVEIPLDMPRPAAPRGTDPRAPALAPVPSVDAAHAYRPAEPPVQDRESRRTEPPMSLNAMLQTVGGHPEYLIGFFLALPLLAWLLGKMPAGGTQERPPFRYTYSTLTYLTTIPGVFSTILVGYSLFFVHQNLLAVNVLSYFLPILSMGVTLVLIGKKVAFEQLPGFGRLAGLIVLIATTFVILLALYKTRIFIGFFGDMRYLMPVGVFLFLLLKWGARKLL